MLHSTTFYLLGITSPPHIQAAHAYPTGQYGHYQRKRFLNNKPTNIHVKGNEMHPLYVFLTHHQQFLENMQTCDNQTMLSTFSGAKLLKIAALNSMKERQEQIDSLLMQTL